MSPLQKGGTFYIFSLKNVAIMFQFSVFLIVAKILAALKKFFLDKFYRFDDFMVLKELSRKLVKEI